MKKSYKDSGVDKEAGYSTVNNIKKYAAKTLNKNVLNTIGDFAALYELSGYKNPVLVSGTDGVGTKIMLARKYNLWDSIGQDCFAMCANDVLCHGARPLFFLDYLACGKLDPETATRIVNSISKSCELTGTALIGGETAEMPGMYQIGDYDVAGFCVGIVEKEKIISGKKTIKTNDVVIGISSSGLHSNGFSLIRQLIKNFDEQVCGEKLYDILLTPTKVYVNLILDLLSIFNEKIKGLAHITGGGVIENLPRIIPEGLTVHINTKAIPIQPVFEFIKNCEVEILECWGTFNMGVGFVIVVPPEDAETITKHINQKKDNAFIMGEIKPQFGSNKNIELHF